MDRHESPNPSPFFPNQSAQTSATINACATTAAFADARKARAFAEEVADVLGCPREHPGTAKLAEALTDLDAAHRKAEGVIAAVKADAKAKFARARADADAPPCPQCHEPLVFEGCDYEGDPESGPTRFVPAGWSCNCGFNCDDANPKARTLGQSGGAL